MGHGRYSSEVHSSTTMKRLADGTDFTYSSDTLRRAPSERKPSPLLDPQQKNKAGDHEGTIIRESLDFPEHPNTTPIVVVLDVTGSMATVPRQIVAELPKLMQGLIDAGVPDPQVLIIANGDAYCDSVPVQIGQFESDNRIDEQINAIVLEGGGGGGNHESYDLIAWFLANKVHLDANEIRDEKGYVFFLADERLYGEIDATQVKKHFGDDIQGHIDTKDVFDALKEKFEVFMLYPHGTGGEHCMDVSAGSKGGGSNEGEWYGGGHSVGTYGWKALLDPEQVIHMKQPSELIQQVASIVATRVGEKMGA